MAVYVMNSPVITNFGVFEFRKATPDEARELLKGGFVSAVGHEASAHLLSKILGIEIPYNRVAIRMQKGDVAVVLWLLQRLPEGKILSDEEISKIQYELGILKML